MNRKSAILAIGDEVLYGHTINSNAAKMAEIADAAGFTPALHIVIKDDPALIKKHLLELSREYDLILTSGGLGPTHDDMTIASIAETLGTELVFSSTIYNNLIQRFPGREKTCENQSMIPGGTEAFTNPVGQAPAILFRLGKAIGIALPGVPAELHSLLNERVLPHLLETFQGPQHTVSDLSFAGLRESEIASFLSELAKSFPKISIGSYPGAGIVTLRLRGENEDVKKAGEVLKAQYAKFAFEHPLHRLEGAILAKLASRGERIALAESCTGGALSARLVQIPGASEALLGGVVAYANEIKIKLLGVPAPLMEKHGAVSEEVVIAMAKGIIALSGAEWGIAISGIAGPGGGSPEKPTGTYFAAICHQGEAPQVFRSFHPHTRETFIMRVGNEIFNKLWERLQAQA